MKRLALISAGMLVVAGCADAKQTESEIVRNQVGRWSIVPAQGDYPALLLDTATGCVMTASLSEGGDIVLDEAKFSNGDDDCDAVLQLPTVDTK